jgi:serine/threonine protein kinase/WD40 repeat protein/Tfp pilus assembly protein PilF
MEPSPSERNPIDALAEEFTQRYRRGERPALSEYTRKYPELAEEIREVFPALVAMEQLKPAASDVGTTAAGGCLPACIGDYRLLREIGRGGMGMVYEAEQVSLARRVALKVFPATGLTNPTYRERFRREAKAAAHLHHTNIVPVFGVGETCGVHYYAMQFIHGEGMDKVLADLRRLRPPPGPPLTLGGTVGTVAYGSVAHGLVSGQFSMPPASEGPAKLVPEPLNRDPSTVTLSASTSGGEYYRSVARIGLQVAEALAYAHKQGILHRDIKPSNLILDLQGRVWITDFGLAKAEDADELTRTGDVVGTIRYMAPERFDGTSLPQGDIYALGMTLYEMVTLRPAFDDANRARLIQRIASEEAPLPRKLVRDIPRDLETIVLKAAARDPADRYVTAEALAEDLQRFLSDRPIRARRHPALERLWRWCRRNPAIAGAISVIAASLLTVALISLLAAVSLNASKRDALAQLWRAKLSEARATALSRQRGQRFTSLQRTREAVEIAAQLGMTEDDRRELRNAAIAALALPDFEVAKEWDGSPAGNQHLDFDAALERYARSDNQGRVSIRRVSDDQEIVALPGLGRPATVRFSPRGRYLVVTGMSAMVSAPLKLWDLDTPEPRCVYEGTSLISGFADISPDDTQLAYESSTHLTIVDIATGQKHAEWRLSGTPGASGAGGVRWGPKGDRLAVGRESNGKWLVEVRQADSGTVLASLWHNRPCQSFAWHPDGRRLAVGTGTKIHLWDVATPVRLGIFEGHRNEGITVAFNRAGDRLISSDWTGTLRLWDVVSGRQMLSVLGVGVVTFGGNDSSLGCRRADGKLQVLRFAAGREVRTLAGRCATAVSHFLHRACLSADGRLVAIQTSDPASATASGLAILDRQTGGALGRLPDATWRPLAFERDGSFWTENGAGDVLRWPSQAATPGGQLRLGPPVPIAHVPGTEARAVTADGAIVVLSNFNQGAMILHRGAREMLLPTGPQDDVRYAALSPDGRWVATGSHWCSSGVGIKVWNAATGRLEKPFTEVSGLVQFSPDGRWLLAGYYSISLWHTGTWEKGPPVQAAGESRFAAFSPDSRLLALGGLGRVRLVRPDTGAEVARLAFAEQTNLAAEAFTPDGAELLVRGEDTQDIHIWDLRLLRAQLAELGLDWDDPPLPPSAATPVVPAVEFAGADLIADVPKLRQYRTTLNVLALTANPFDAAAHFRLAQLTDNPTAAMGHYTASLAFDPKQPMSYENRAVEAFRLKRWTQVVADMDQVLNNCPERPRALDYRALAHRHLCQHEKAVADLTALLPANGGSSRLYELRARSYDALGSKHLADEDRKKAQQLAPDDPIRLNERAWALATGSAADRDPQLAVKLAQRAVELTPNESALVNTLGVAQYRNGQFSEALVTLERSLALGNGRWDGCDLFFLAMCHQKLGDPQKANDCFDRAVRWLAEQKKFSPREREELRAFQAEAHAELTASANRPKHK